MRVVLADDSVILREGLARLLEEAGFEVDGEAQVVDAGQAITIEKGSARRIAAGPDGVRYLSVHIRRAPLQISQAPAV